MRSSSAFAPLLLATALSLSSSTARASEPEPDPEPAAVPAPADPEPAAVPAPAAAPADPAPADPGPAERPSPAPALSVSSSPPNPPSRPGADRGATPASTDDDGPLGALRLGMLAGTGAPSIFSAELLVKYKGWVGLAADFGTLPTTNVPIGSGIAVSQTHLSAAARVFPFHGAFFVGAGVGSQQLSGRAQESAQGVTGSIAMTSRTVFVMPQVGFVYRFSFGLALGSDVGVELPLLASSSVDTVVAGTAVAAPEGVRNVVRFVQRNPVPVINLLRVGFML